VGRECHLCSSMRTLFIVRMRVAAPLTQHQPPFLFVHVCVRVCVRACVCVFLQDLDQMLPYLDHVPTAEDATPIIAVIGISPLCGYTAVDDLFRPFTGFVSVSLFRTRALGSQFERGVLVEFDSASRAHSVYDAQSRIQSVLAFDRSVRAKVDFVDVTEEVIFSLPTPVDALGGPHHGENSDEDAPELMGSTSAVGLNPHAPSVAPPHQAEATRLPVEADHTDAAQVAAARLHAARAQQTDEEERRKAEVAAVQAAELAQKQLRAAEGKRLAAEEKRVAAEEKRVAEVARVAAEQIRKQEEEERRVVNEHKRRLEEEARRAAAAKKKAAEEEARRVQVKREQEEAKRVKLEREQAAARLENERMYVVV
jgi:hypothetical protein